MRRCAKKARARTVATAEQVVMIALQPSNGGAGMGLNPKRQPSRCHATPSTYRSLHRVRSAHRRQLWQLFQHKLRGRLARVCSLQTCDGWFGDKALHKNHNDS